MSDGSLLRSTDSEFLDRLAREHTAKFCDDPDCWCKDPESYDLEQCFPAAP